MQQQDNDFPIDQIQSGPPTTPADPSGGLAGGTTFQPQMSGQPEPQPPTTPAPGWQQDTANDAAQLYNQPSDPTTSVGVPQPTATPDASQVPGVPVSPQPDATQPSGLVIPQTEPQGGVPVSPQPEMPTPMQTLQEPMPITPTSEVPSPPPVGPVATGGIEPTATPVPTPVEPAPLSSFNPSPNPVPMPAPQEPMSSLPGSSQLGVAASGMDQTSVAQSNLDPNMAGIDPLTAGMDGAGAYGPPPKSKKKLLFIIGGVVIGLIIITIIVVVIANNSARKPAQNLNPTTPSETTPTPEPTPTPSSGPATPPQGYVTIEKQCYSFALFDPNTVPTDQACSFKDATFGKLKTSKISVISITDSYKNLDEYVNTIKPTLTVTAEESIKLDNFDAKQLIYKASDGKTYSKVLALIVGKNYQQDGKPVTGIDITTSYQEDFDKTVTKNVLDTWRWK